MKNGLLYLRLLVRSVLFLSLTGMVVWFIVSLMFWWKTGEFYINFGKAILGLRMAVVYGFGITLAAFIFNMLDKIKKRKKEKD
ncbi:hypothetical protein [Nissabacter sp. SGAir0207]|uniref:hypothetical protein n=1 Tax=Nissabacter sp. SGAir0207 TaxID=2126321 RepID=UPI0010CD154B|nr:hypothetical protein [Nissabacter sp. SGAir0207]QCR35505.1 hypothetical protein C1N62_05095 [Nissabacter sp. SGAir0207]